MKFYLAVERWLGRFTILLFIFGLFFLAIELYERQRPQLIGVASFMSEDHHHPKPFVMAAGKPYANDNNALGYRGYLPELPKPKEEFRIFLLGGSTVHLTTLPMDLQDQFTRNEIDHVRVYNFGITSSISRQDVSRIWLDMAGLEPDLILHYSGGNEMTYGPDRRVNYPHRFFLFENNPLLAIKAEDYDLGLALMLSSQWMRNHFAPQLLDRFSDDTKALLKAEHIGVEQEGVLRAQAYVQNLRWGQLMAQAQGARYFVVFQPLVYFKNKVHPKEIQFAHLETEFVKIRKWRKNFLKEVEKHRHEITFFDRSEIFLEDKKQNFIDPIHVVDEENPRIAQALFNLIKESGVLTQNKAHPRLRSLHSEIHFQGIEQ